mgnify:CR=1 FL=1
MIVMRGDTQRAALAASDPEAPFVACRQQPDRQTVIAAQNDVRGETAGVEDPQRTLADLPWPVLMVHGVLSNELPDTAEATAEGFPLLPDSSQMVHVHAETLDQAQEEVARLSLEWAQRRLR